MVKDETSSQTTSVCAEYGRAFLSRSKKDLSTGFPHIRGDGGGSQAKENLADYYEKEYSSIDEFVMETGRNPVVLPANVATPISIQYVHDVLYSDMLEIAYLSKDGHAINLRQEWNIVEPSVCIIPNEEHEETLILNETTMIGITDTLNQTFSGYALLRDLFISLGCEEITDAVVGLSNMLDSIGTEESIG